MTFIFDGFNFFSAAATKLLLMAEMNGVLKVKNSWSREEMLTAQMPFLAIEDESGMRSSYYPELAVNNLNFPDIDQERVREMTFERGAPSSVSSSLYDCLSRGEKQILEQRSNSAVSPVLLDSGIRAASYGEARIEKAKKMASAKTLLRDFSRHYESIFRQRIHLSEADLSETRVFFNSNLLYLIAATDGNEDNAGHSQLVARYTLMLTKALGIEEKEYLLSIERGALLHDIGKIGIPESILRKPGALSEAERDIIKEHPQLGYEMIEEFHFLKKAARVVLFHHERYDGLGYPYGLEGEEIPLEARIFAIADTLDAMTSDRPYRAGQSFQSAFDEIERGRGSQFDPSVVDAFFSAPEERWHQIKIETEDSLRLLTIH
jgi:putative nucleotidyltransferase with HDIG domain